MALNLIKIYPSTNQTGGGGVAQFPTNQNGDMYIPAVGTDEFVELAQSIQANINSVSGRQFGGDSGNGLDTRVWMTSREDAIGGQLGCADAMSANLAVKQCINRLRADCPLVGGGDSKGKGQFKGKGKAAPINQEERERREKVKRDVEIRETKLRDYVNSPEMNLRGLFAHTAENPVDLGDVYKLGLAERIMMALYFAYQTHLGIYDSDPSGKSYAYILKYSPIKGSLEDSSLKETLKIHPNFVLYNTFAISEMGKKLSIASHMPDIILDKFRAAKAKIN